MIPPDLQKILVICGPTASGKSELAVRLAHFLNAEIVNADSVQIYRGMDIGAAKPTIEEREGIPHHMLDAADPDQSFSAADFAEAAMEVISGILKRGRRAIVVGGSGLYIRSLIHGLADSPSGSEEIREELREKAKELGNYHMLEQLRVVDPELAATIHPNNLTRIIRGLETYRLAGVPLSQIQREHGFARQCYAALKIGVRVERQELYDRIEKRVDRMLAAGLADEADCLLKAGFHRELKAMRSIGYKEICSFLAGDLTLEEAMFLIKRNSRRYAKRQFTWFKADPDIIWLEYPKSFAIISQHCIDFFA